MERSNQSLMKVIVSLVAILLGFIVGALLMISSGANPFEGFSYLFKGGLSSITRVCNTIAYGIPLILTGLSISFAYKTGLFNIGATGQFLMGGLAANVLALTLDLPRIFLLPIVIIGAIVGGMVWASVPGFLKAKFNVNEVVSCIMMNWVAYYIVYYVILDNFKSTTIDTDSRVIPAAASLKSEWIQTLTKGSNLNYGLVIAILAVIFVIWVLNKTVLGYEMKAVGFNRFAAEYGGVNVEKNTILAMAIAGALSGLAGLTFYCGYLSNMRIGVMPTQGFDGIAVALLANLSPVGVIFSAIFFSILQTGKGFMNAMIPIPPEIADTIIAIIIYFAAAGKLIELNMKKIKRVMSRNRNKIKGDKTDVADN